MGRTVNYSKRAAKIKGMIDALVEEMAQIPRNVEPKVKLKPADIDFENEELVTLIQIQARISRIILEKSK